jgi:hypothetical protein
MSHPRIINENMLDEWIRANARIAQGVTVELVARLVSTSCPSPNHRRFPLTDSIGQHGPDGELDTPVGLPPSVPDGRSFWEIGAGLDARAKANSDYNDITGAVPENVREASSFIFVTPLSGRRDWENTWKEDGIATWVEERRKRKEWANVHVLNGTSLIDWLYRFPAVERWLAGVMGQKIDFIETLDARWETLRMIGNPPPLSPELFTSNRQVAVEKLQKVVIDRDGSQLKLDTRQPEQAADFVCAYASSLPDEQRIEAIGRCLIITQEDAWSGVCSLNESHVLIADFDLESDRGAKLIQSALNRRHAVVFAGMPGGIPHANRAPLPVPDEYQIRAALEKAGYPKERARRLANACRSDLNALLRCLQGLSEMPGWAQMTEAAEIAIAMLIGGWVENVPGDCSAVEGIVGKRYGEWIQVVRNVTSSSSTPLKLRNGCWHMASRFEAWQLLGRRLFDDDLERFKTVAVSVLRETDPALELSPDARFAASMYGKERPHSSRLRKGIAETLALLGTYPKALSACTDGKAEGTATCAVRKVLASGSAALWASLNDVLPLLAEASPEAFSDAVDTALHSDEGAFNTVFSQESNGVGGRTYITGVLWGLETLAWESAYLVQVCRILADLAALDPGGNWTNRPSNSLTTILLPWFPQTCAPTEVRHAAVRVVVRRQPQIAWKLLLSLLPESHSISSGTHKPIWRPFIPEDWKEGASRGQHWEDVLAYGQLASEMAGNDVEKLSALVERYFRLPNEVRLTLRQRLSSQAVLALEESARFRLWCALTRLTNNHRKFAGHENWSVPDGALEALDVIANSLCPAAPEVRHKRLFGGVDADLYEEMGNFEEQEKLLNTRRQEAVREIVSKGGEELLLGFAAKAGEPWRVGFVYASLADLAQDTVVLPSLLEPKEKALLQFAGGYVWGRHKAGGWTWVDSLALGSWTNPAKGQFFTFLPFCEDTWARVTAAMAGDEKDYWQNTSANPYESTSGIETALEKLIAVDRPDVAIHCMQILLHQGKAMPSNTAIKALGLLRDEHRIDAYAIGEVLTFLQKDPSANESDVRQSEWKFLRFLGEFHNGHPVFLSRWMAEDPKFFCEVIRTLFRSKKEDPKSEPSDENKERATNAYHLLNEWRIPPGTQRDGTFDSGALVSWLTAVKATCIESGHWEVAAGQIGEVLFYAPRDTDGLWIEPVCAVLDDNDHSGLRRGLTMEVFNTRGVFTPDRGKSEIALAEHWSQKASLAEQKGFSMLGQELRRLADSYRADADREAKESTPQLD